MALADVFYSALNPIVTAVLRSPFHGLGSANLCILTFRGRRSGRRYSTPLSYMREGSLVRLLSSQRTKWWKNFLLEPAEVEVEIAGRTHHGRARALVFDDASYREGIRRFLSAVPRDARVYGIRLDADRQPREDDLEKAAGHVVLVEVELED
jgi:hypothetical protein